MQVLWTVVLFLEDGVCKDRCWMGFMVVTFWASMEPRASTGSDREACKNEDIGLRKEN